MSRSRKKKRSNLWMIPAAALILLAAFGLRRFVGRPERIVLPKVPRVPAAGPAAGDITGLLETLSERGFTVRALSPGDDSSRNFLIYVPPGFPLVQANLAIGRLAGSQKYRPLRSLENRKKQRLDLSFISRDSAALNITVLKRRAPLEAPSSLPRIALVLYFWPPEKSSLEGQFNQVSAVKSLIVKGLYASQGHEAYCSVAMEPKGYPKNDPGPNTILVDDPSGKVRDKLNDAGDAATEPAGFYIWQGSRAVEDARIADILTSHCSRSQLILIEPFPTAQSLIKKAASQNSCLYLAPDLVVDARASANACLSQLRNQLSRTGTRAMILLPATENALKALKQLITKETAARYEFVPVSGMLQ